MLTTRSITVPLAPYQPASYVTTSGGKCKEDGIKQYEGSCYCCWCSIPFSWAWICAIWAINLLLIFVLLLVFLLQWGKLPGPSPVPGYEGPAPMLMYPYAGVTTAVYDMYPPFMVSAVWGMDNCVGVDDPSPEWARDHGCVAVHQDTTGDGVGDGPLISRTIPRARVGVLFRQGSSRPGAEDDALFPLDAVAVTFSWPVEPDSLQWDDIEVKLADGRVVKPDVVSTAPANDPNERSTVTIYGQFADHSAGDNDDWVNGHLTTPGMVSVSVVSDLILTNGTHRFNALGARFMHGNLIFEKGVVLTGALLRPYDRRLNPVGEGRDNCGAHEGITHVLQALTNGGHSKDGVNMINRDQVKLFTVTMKNGGDLRSDAFAGLADVDGDDFTDICLRLNPAEVPMLDKLILNCDEDQPLLRVALPHGNKEGFSPCTDTKPQPIALLRCPESIYCR